MAYERAVDKKARLAKEARNAARAKRRDEKRAELAASLESESKVSPKALGVEKAVAGTKAPKTITTARENLTAAFDQIGGVPMLVKWGKKNPTEFYRIWARLIPKEAEAESTALPLETLLGKLSERAHLSVEEAAVAIGKEVLDEAAGQVSLEDAAAAYGRTIQ